MNNASKGHCVTVTPQGKRGMFLSSSGILGNDNPPGITTPSPQTSFNRDQEWEFLLLFGVDGPFAGPSW